MSAFASLLFLLPAGDARAQTVADTLPVRVAEKQIATFNARDLDGFMALYAEDAVASEFPSGKVMWQGKAAIRAGFAPMFAAKDAPRVRVEPRVVNGAFVVDNENWEAKPGERHSAVWMYEIRGGLIRRSWAVRLR
jgi:hypothetical protein